MSDVLDCIEHCFCTKKRVFRFSARLSKFPIFEEFISQIAEIREFRFSFAKWFPLSLTVVCSLLTEFVYLLVKESPDDKRIKSYSRYLPCYFDFNSFPGYLFSLIQTLQVLSTQQDPKWWIRFFLLVFVYVFSCCVHLISLHFSHDCKSHHRGT